MTVTDWSLKLGLLRKLGLGTRPGPRFQKVTAQITCPRSSGLLSLGHNSFKHRSSGMAQPAGTGTCHQAR